MAAGVDKPLRGRRVLVTRPRGQAAGVRAELQALGAEVEVVPVIEILPPEDLQPLYEAAGRLPTYHWVVFTSRNGVDSLARVAGRPTLGGSTRVACIGPATAEAVRRLLGWRVHLQPKAYVAESLVEAFREVGVSGARVLLARAQEARDTLPEGLRGLGAHVDVVAAYRTEPAYNEAEHLQEVLRRGVDLATFASPSAVRAAVQLCGGPELLRGIPAACIGPVTAAEARRLGLGVVAVAEDFTQRGLVHAVVRALGAGREGGR